MESGSKELSEKMAREEEQRRKEAQEMKERLETDKRQQVTISPTFYEQLFCTKVFSRSFSVLKVCVCNVLPKEN